MPLPHPLVRQHGELALLELYDAALPQVHGYLLARCGDRALAEDLTADAFLAAAQAVRREIPPEVTTGWLIGIARHKLVDHWRREATEARHLRAVAAEADDEHDPWEACLDAIVAREVLATLGAHHRAVLTLRYLDGLGVAEVAGHLDRGVRATEALLVRARRAFRAAYTARIEDGGDEA